MTVSEAKPPPNNGSDEIRLLNDEALRILRVAGVCNDLKFDKRRYFHSVATCYSQVIKIVFTFQ